MPSNETENIYATQYGGSGEPIPSTKISYDNTGSGLSADNVQEAIDEVAGDVTTLATTVSGITNLPALPSDATAGTYVLKATKADDTVTYSWVAEV